MNIVDSSGWLAYLADEPNAKWFLAPLREPESLLVPVVSIYEVCKVIFRERGENEALQVCAAMQTATVVDITAPLALSAARLSLQHRIPMADSIMLAVARVYHATLWTQDGHFKGMPDVKYFPPK